MNFVSAYCLISNHSVRMNRDILFSKNENEQDDFAKQIYKNFKIDYSKFYKMDLLSKIAFLGVEILKMKYPPIKNYRDDEIALFFSNSVSSADVDMKFQKSYSEENSPSPALFVYTLPNILIGEIAIRNKWFGENLFTILSNFDAEFFVQQCDIFLEKKAKACLCGWVNVLDKSIEAFIFFIEKNKTEQNNLELNSETLIKLYKQ